MNTHMKLNGIEELNMNDMEQTSGGWLITIGVIVTWGAVLTSIPYIMGYND